MYIYIKHKLSNWPMVQPVSLSWKKNINHMLPLLANTAGLFTVPDAA